MKDSLVIDIIALLIAIIALICTFMQYKLERLQTREEFIINRIKSLYLFTKNSIKLLKELEKNGMNKSDFRDESYKDDLYADYLMRINKTKNSFNYPVVQNIFKKLYEKINYINELERYAIEIRNCILQERRKYPILNDDQKHNSEKLSKKDIENFNKILKEIRNKLNKIEEQEMSKEPLI